MPVSLGDFLPHTDMLIGGAGRGLTASAGVRLRLGFQVPSSAAQPTWVRSRGGRVTHARGEAQ